MKTRVTYIIFFILIIFAQFTNSQNIKHCEKLPMLLVKNKQFDSILTNSISCLKECNPNKTPFLGVTFASKDQSIYIDIITYYEKKMLLTDKFWKPYGYIYKENILFVVFGEEQQDFIEKTNIKKKFIINDKLELYYPEENIEWLYSFQKGNIVLEKVVNNKCCDK